MATQTNTSPGTNVLLARDSSKSLTEVVRAVLAPLASLKLTVGLLGLSVFVIWLITLEQATIDIWALKHKHFTQMWVFVPFQTFLPPNWYPGVDVGNGGFYLPSGITLIMTMLVNLVSAHLLRFRIQAAGWRLGAGIAVVIASSVLTWAIMFNGQDADGFQGRPPIPWFQMWRFLQIAVLGLAIGSALAALRMEPSRAIERITLGLLAAIMLALLGLSVYHGEKAFIGDSAMRILWQLIQSTLAAMAMLAGCMLLFRRKAGIVLLHMGIAGLLINEIFVSVTNEEHRVSFAEGQTVHHAIDLRETEFVVIDRSDPESDAMTVLPGNLLRGSSDVIDDGRFPFKIKCVEYFQNCDIVRVGPHAENRADSGLGMAFLAVPQKPSAGADPDSAVDKAGAYVKLIDREMNEPIGTWLVSQAAYDNELLDTVRIDDRDFQIGLRFKTVYMPYSLTLNDADSVNYVGTAIPKTFSSEFVIDDRENGIASNQRIWMNNPLRYRDQTFYQTTYLIDPETKKEYSGIQVVRNRGWMIPYVCCMFVVVGLVYQFQLTLATFLAKPNRNQLDALSNSGNRSSWAAWLPTALLLGIFGLYYGSQLVRSISPSVTRAKGSEIRLDLLGRVPVTYGGRVQPLDSYARNLARQLSKRELVEDGLGRKQPAIRWLADLMFGVSAADDFQILRIEDLTVQNALGLPRRKGHKFTLAEIRAADSRLFKLLVKAKEAQKQNDAIDDQEKTTQSVFRERLSDVYASSRMLMSVATAFSGTEGRYEPGDALGRLEAADNLVKIQSAMPFAVPTGDPEAAWMPLSIAIERQWLGEIADGLDDPSIASLQQHLLTTETAKLKTELVRKRIIYGLLQNKEIMEAMVSRFDLKDQDQLADVLYRNWESMPKELYEGELKDAEQFVEFQTAAWRSKNEKLLAEMLLAINGGSSGPIRVPDPRFVEDLAGLKQAYVDGDAAEFNSRLERHLAAIEAESPVDWSPTRQGWEIAYNHFSPFHVASALYLIGFIISVFSWIGMRGPINRAAFWLICFALLIHVGGIVARVVISGRPPITNLYSSFVVVTAGCIVALLVIERITRLGLGNLLAGACGYLTLLYAWTLSIKQGDTFSVLRAVLDTQFWLTTHVVIINLGYSATLVAGLVGLVFLFGMFLTRGFDKPQRKAFSGIIYGTTCFALLFSFFGTVLGGLWGDDSWGRFWGWDPKENGALMIVLWNALILHSRWAGIVRERGLAALAVFGIIVTMWSWEGVNQLGVGLHAYGGIATGGEAGSFLSEPIFWLQTIAALLFCVTIIAAAMPLSWFRSFAAEKPAPTH